MINSILDSYLVGLVLGAGFSGIVASLFALHHNMASVFREGLINED